MGVYRFLKVTKPIYFTNQVTIQLFSELEQEGRFRISFFRMRYMEKKWKQLKKLFNTIAAELIELAGRQYYFLRGSQGKSKMVQKKSVSTTAW